MATETTTAGTTVTTGANAENTSFADLMASFAKSALENPAAAATPTGETPTAQAGEGEPPAEADTNQVPAANPPEAAASDTGSEQAAAEGSGEPVEGTPEATTGGEGSESTVDDLTAILDEAKIPQNNRKLVKRLHKLVDDLQSEREARTVAERRLAEHITKPDAQAEKASEAISNHAQQSFADPKIQEMDKELVKLNQCLAYIDDHPDGEGITNAKGEAIDISPEQLRAQRRTWEEQRSTLIARREARSQFLEQQNVMLRERAHGEASKVYPWLNNPASAEYKEAEAIIRNVPWLASLTDVEMLLGDLITGKKHRPNGQPKPASKPAPAAVVTRAASAAPRINPQAKDLDDKQKAFEQSGSAEDLKNWFAAKRRAGK